jgi:hypothetical protein
LHSAELAGESSDPGRLAKRGFKIPFPGEMVTESSVQNIAGAQRVLGFDGLDLDLEAAATI